MKNAQHGKRLCVFFIETDTDPYMSLMWVSYRGFLLLSPKSRRMRRRHKKHGNGRKKQKMHAIRQRKNT